METKQDYQAQLNTQVRLLDEQIQYLQRNTTKASLKGKAEFLERISVLKAKRKELGQQLHKLQLSSENAWDEVKEGAENIWSEVLRTTAAALAQF